MVMAVQGQHSRGVSGLLVTSSAMIGNPETVSELDEDYDF
jgi:hypothetical protein